MRKKLLKGFTLVEILIVIVIIGILIGALVPRMSAAQGRARDVARKNDLAQLQSAIVTSQQDKGKWPGMDSATSGDAKKGIGISDIADKLQTAGMNSIPKDPLGSNIVLGIGATSKTFSGGEYAYMVSKRNGTDNAGFILMAKTEVEGGSNWVVCNSGSRAKTLSGGWIGEGQDLGKLNLCTSMDKVDSADKCVSNTADCKYYEDGELRYILLY